MRRPHLSASALLVSALLLAPSALAQTPAPAPAPAAPAPAAPAAPAAAEAPKGPSPYSEAVQKGDRAYLARDFDGAVAAYRQEIEKNPNVPLGHYRLGEAQLAKGDTNEAELSWQAALRFAGKDERMRSKILFVLADLKERLGASDDAVTRFNDYLNHSKANPTTKTYPASASDRIKRAEEWKKIVADSAEVKARIEKRIKEADESMRKSSK
jgi:TolA-binding protein